MVELLVVIAMIAILAALLLSALNGAKQHAQGIVCLSNLRQVDIAWKSYASDNSGIFPLNPAESDPQYLTNDWVVGIESWWADNPMNTNYECITRSLLGPYVAQQPKIYKCPADVWQCMEGGKPMDRVRSISMNSFVGMVQQQNGFAAEYALSDNLAAYASESSILSPSPSSLYVFLDEHANSINDGFFIFYAPYVWEDTPANYHDGACGFAFADGHAEIHKWLLGYLWPRGVITAPGNFPNIAEDWGNYDTPWMFAHSTSIK